jgi:tetratricopeptide (TPR) repeat protein
MNQAQEKLQLGLERLRKADNDPDLLGLALLSFHGALEDHFRDVLISTNAMPPEQRARVQDAREVQWKEIIDLMQRYHHLNDNHRNWILSIDRLRQGAGHGGRFTGTRLEVEKYGDFVRAQMNGVTSSRPIVSQLQHNLSTNSVQSARFNAEKQPGRDNFARRTNFGCVGSIGLLSLITIGLSLDALVFERSKSPILDPISVSRRYVESAIDKLKERDYQGALSDYNQAVKLNPENKIAYKNRGKLKSENLYEYQGALSDYNQAIKLKPDSAIAYNDRGFLKHYKLQDYRGAVADYNQAIKLDSSFSTAYNNRALVRYEQFQDYQGALADYNLAIKLDPTTYATFYHNRSLLKYYRFDRNDAINDMKQAAQIAQKQGDENTHQKVIDKLIDWGVR